MKRHEGPQLAFDFGAEPAPSEPAAPAPREPPRKPRPRPARPSASEALELRAPLAPSLEPVDVRVAEPSRASPEVREATPSREARDSENRASPAAREVEGLTEPLPERAPSELVRRPPPPRLETVPTAITPDLVGLPFDRGAASDTGDPPPFEGDPAFDGSDVFESRAETVPFEGAPFETGAPPPFEGDPAFDGSDVFESRAETVPFEDAPFEGDPAFDGSDVFESRRAVPFESAPPPFEGDPAFDGSDVFESRGAVPFEGAPFEGDPPFDGGDVFEGRGPAPHGSGEREPFATGELARLETVARGVAPAQVAVADIVFVVPTGRHVERFVLAGYEATTFPMLEERMLARLTELTVATRAEERAFLAVVLDDYGSVNEIAGMELGSAGFAEAFLDALDDVSRMVGSFARARGEAPDVAAKRVRFMTTLEDRLDQALSDGGLVARRKVPELLATRIALADPAVVEESLGARALETRLLVDLSPSHLALVRALELFLAPRGGRATVCLPMHDRPFDSERTPDPLERVSTWALSHLEDAPRTVLLEPRLGTLEAVSSSEEPLDGVEIRLAASRQAEAHAVVSAVAEALANGARVESVAVGVMRTDDVFFAELGKAFAEAEIVAHGLSHERSMLPPFLTEALAALDKTDARTFLRLISSPYVDLGLPPKEARAHLSALVRKLSAGPNVVASTARSAAQVAVARAARPHARTNSNEREREMDLVDRAFVAFESFPLEGTVSELAHATLRWFVALGVPSRASRADVALFASDHLDTFAALEAAALARDARAWEAFETALVEVEHANLRAGRGDAVVARARFFDELFAVYQPAAALPGASRSFAVRVAKLTELADEDLDLLVVPMATSAGLGAPPPRSALLSKEVLVALGHDHAVASAKGFSALALAASRATRVVFTACEGDDDESSPISPVVMALASRGASVTTFGRGSRLATPLSTLDLALVRLLAGERPRDPEALARVEVEREREGFFLSERRPLSAVVGVVASDDALAVLGDESGRERPLALTGLERLAECAFRGYAHILLGAREPMEDAELPTARDEGTRLHGALYVALSAVRELLRARPRDVMAIVDEAEAAASRYLVEVETGGPLEPLLDRRVRAVVRAVAKDAATDDRWTFEVGEQAFGEAGESSWPALELGEGAETVRLRGRIDRVDVGSLRASGRVIDYKRGRLDDLARKLGTTALQVPLYALSAKKPLDVDEVKGIYYSLRDDELARPNEKLRGEEVVEGLLADRTVERTVLAVVNRLRQGDLAPRPPTETLCRTCGLAGGCRRPRFAMPAEEDELGGLGPGGAA